MTCVICKTGLLEPGRVTVTLQRDGCTVVFKEVPAQVCDNCGEYVLNAQVTAELLRRADQAAANGAEVEILSYAA
jgi:YgiT-type zinc finger domain-containing protein